MKYIRVNDMITSYQLNYNIHILSYTHFGNSLFKVKTRLCYHLSYLHAIITVDIGFNELIVAGDVTEWHYTYRLYD